MGQGNSLFQRKFLEPQNVETLKNSDVDLLIIFAWNYSKMIIEKTQFRKFKYLVAFPTVQIVDTYEELKGFDSI